ncbi:MAG: hypothetical protein IKO55_05270 [Kiritimatiellae bacterium]|nr:hypothetical protein [Kiritimatiellia bacterium]
MPENLEIYNAVRSVPSDAKKKITGGRLNGKTDINPMWRIKTLTAQFGPCGIGWYYEITKQWLETGHGGEIAAFCNINLYVCVDGEWSRAIPGTGGSAFVASESKGLYTSDECFKMALTDALSVACKSLGFGADVYWEADSTKYDVRPTTRRTAAPAPAPAPAPAEEFDQELETAIADLRAAKSRAEVGDVNKKYREIYGTYSALPNPRYIDALREMSKKFPKPTPTLNK